MRSPTATSAPVLLFWSSWDPAMPAVSQLFARSWAAASAGTALRRFAIRPLVLQAWLLAAALAFPAEAHATALTVNSPILYAIGVHDSYGIPLWKYAISTDYGTVLDGGTNAVMATLLEAEAALFVTIVGLAIWFLIYVVSFGFMPDLVQPVAEVVQEYAGHILPGVMACSALVAAAMVSYNVYKGRIPQAVSMGVTVLVVSAIAGAVAYTPITWVISEDGPLATGRNAAVSLGSNSTASPENTTATLDNLEGTLATSFARHPFQVLNFGGQPDDSPACAAAWNDGVNSGKPDNIKDNIARCGSPGSPVSPADAAAMKATADNPSAGQLGTGFALMIFAGLFALYALSIAVKIVAEFFEGVKQAAKFLGSLAIGVIQAALPAVASSGIGTIFCGVAMFAYITIVIVVGEIAGRIFSRQGNSIVAMLSVLLLMVIAIKNSGRIGKAVRKGGHDVANAMLSSFAGPQAPPEVNNIIEDRAGGFMRATSNAVFGVGGTVAGMALASRAPSAAQAFNVVAPVLNNKMARHINRGTHLKYTLNGNNNNQNSQGAQPNTSTAPNQSTAPPGPGGPGPGQAQPAQQPPQTASQPTHSAPQQQSAAPTTGTPPAPAPAAAPPAPAPQQPATGAQPNPAPASTTSPAPAAPQWNMNWPWSTAGPAQPGSSPAPAPPLAPPTQRQQISAPNIGAPPAAPAPPPKPGSVAEHRQRFPHLCGEKRVDGGYCLNAAGSCPNHGGSAPPSPFGPTPGPTLPPPPGQGPQTGQGRPMPPPKPQRGDRP